MGRKASGQVIPPRGRQKSWAIRFQAYGKRRYVTLGTVDEGWDHGRAAAELRHVMSDVERGIWQPREPEVPQEGPPESPTLHEFASLWLANREPELRPKTVASYRWMLSDHLLPRLGQTRVDAITAQAVDAYKAAKLREHKAAEESGEKRSAIAPNQINKSLGLLAQILDAAGDYGYADPARNPARGRRRRVNRTRPERPTMEPEQLPGLLDSASRGFRPILSALAGAGLRNGEACALNWRDVNLASGTIHVGDAKTEAGVRHVDVPDALREFLTEHKARLRASGPSDPVFPNREGRRQTVSNVERRLKTAVRRANVALSQMGIEPIGEGLTPHSLRRLYASLRFALGDDPVYVAEQLGHTEPAFSMKVYARAVKRRERLTGAALREFDRACEWARIGAIEAPDKGSRGRQADFAPESAGGVLDG